MNKTPQTPPKPIHDQIKEQLKELVIARLMTVPEDLRLSIGDTEYSKDDAIEHVREGDAVGIRIMDLQLEYLQDLATGKLYDDEQGFVGNQTEP